MGFGDGLPLDPRGQTVERNQGRYERSSRVEDYSTKGKCARLRTCRGLPGELGQDAIIGAWLRVLARRAALP